MTTVTLRCLSAGAWSAPPTRAARTASQHWGLHYAGWTWNFNDVRIPHKAKVKKAAS
jgi:hypothetical protein